MILLKDIFIEIFFTKVVEIYNNYIIKKRKQISAIRDSVTKSITLF